MKKIQNSTKSQPLLFFEQFLKKESLISFEREFYENPINPSFKANKELGYVEYIKDLYEGNESTKYVKLTFNDILEKQLKLKLDLSLNLIKERKEEIENTEKTSNVYINRQISKLNVLRKSLNYEYSFISIVIDLLDEIMKTLLGFLEQEHFQNIIEIKIPGITFFDLKEEIKPRHLKKLYEITVDLNIIDEDLVSKVQFIDVLTSTKLPNANSKIIFKKNNRLSVYYLNIIGVFFNDFTPSKISKSKSFFKKKGNVLDENLINNINTFLRKNDTSKYKDIKKELKKILPV